MSTNNCRRVSFEKRFVVEFWQWQQDDDVESICTGAMRTIEIKNIQMND
jgi:hypothetical protein